MLLLCFFLDSDKYNFLPKTEHILNVSYFGESKDYKYNHNAFAICVVQKLCSYRVKGIVSSKSVVLIPNLYLPFFLNSKVDVLNLVQLGFFCFSPPPLKSHWDPKLSSSKKDIKVA